MRRQSSCTRSARSRCPPAAGLPYLRASPQPLRRMLSKGARPHPSPSQTSPLTITPRAHPTPRAPLRFLSLAPAPRARKREEGGGRSESERERERERAREGARERETPPTATHRTKSPPAASHQHYPSNLRRRTLRRGRAQRRRRAAPSHCLQCADAYTIVK